MKKTLLLLALLPSLAFGQGLALTLPKSPTFSQVTLPLGANLCLNGATCTSFIDANASGANIQGTSVFITTGTGGKVNFSNCYAGAAGNTTCNQTSGTSLIAAGASTIDITTSSAAAVSSVLATINTADTTCTFIKSAVPTAGHVVITMNANCAADTRVTWFVFNN